MTRLLDAPHRIFFFAAAVQVLIASAWWAGVLTARAGGVASALPPGLPPPQVHAFLMIYGFLPLFIFGFLYTAGPRWLARPAPRRPQYALPAIVAGLAAAALVPAFHLGAGLAAILMLVMLGAWGWMLGDIAVMIMSSSVRDRLHPILAACALAVGLVGIGAARIWLLTGSQGAMRVMEIAGLWGFLVPLFVTMSHRMIPLFSGEAALTRTIWRPSWVLAALGGGSLAHGLLALLELHAWTWVVDAPMAAVASMLVWRWGFALSSANRLIAMLHIGFAWLAFALLLHALQSLALLAGAHHFGLAATHALTIGFLSSLTLAMVSRVSCGQSGRSIRGDRLTWAVFVVLQIAATARVVADVLTGAYSLLLVAAAALWLASFMAWAWRYLPFYWERSAEGRPG
jgi:uncharacterized protein involved in response to NO